MSWSEVKKSVDWLCEDLGYKPGNMRKFEASPIDEASVALRFLEPAESYIEDVLYSKPVGVLIKYATDKYPENPDEGTLVIDNTTLGAYETNPYVVNGLTSGVTYYFSAFPYTALGSMNTTGGVNRCTVSPLKNETCTVTVVVDDTSSFTSANITYVNETKTTSEVKSVTPSALSVVFNVPEGDTYHIEFGAVEGYSQPSNSESYVAVGGGTRSVTGNYYHSTAKLTVECLPNTIVTCTSGDKVLNGTATGTSVVFEHVSPGDWSVTGLLNGEATTSGSINIPTGSGEYTVTLAKIVPWSTGTDEEIALMVKAADAGFIDLTDYWAVGQERVVHLSAMSGGGIVSEDQPEQDVTMVLMHQGEYPLADGGTASFVVGMKDCLINLGYMDTNNLQKSWVACRRYQWMNEIFYPAIPASIKGIFKLMAVSTASEGGSTVSTTTQNYFTLPAEKEVYGNDNASRVDEAWTFQFEWYKTANNRVKTSNETLTEWRHRTPNHTYGFSSTLQNGTAKGGMNSSNLTGISPFGCI